MFIFNPVIEDKSPNCRCKDCLHAFWLHIDKEHDYLSCHCDLLHSFTFPNFNASEKITLCKGCEDVIPFSKRADRSICKKCKSALWYVTDKRKLYCYCLHLQKLVYGVTAKQKVLPLIVRCNGVLPIQKLTTENKVFPTDINQEMEF